MIKNSILLFISLCSMVSSAQPVINDTIKIGNYLVVLRAPRPHAVRSQHFECSHFINISCPNDMTVISVFWGVNTMRNFIKGKEISKISKRNANGSRFTRRITSTNISGKLLFEVEDDYEDSNISVMCYRVPSEKLNDYENMLDNVRIVNLSPGDATQPYKYTGKELDRQNGADTYDYHARQHLSAIGQFLQMDPKCEETPWLSPYTFCAGNPIRYADYDGQRIVFVNGYLGFGSPQGGSKYWNGANSGFVRGAKVYFKDNYTQFLSINHNPLSSANERFFEGLKYADKNFSTIMRDYKSGETVKFVTHSMGASFAEGMALFLQSKGVHVSNIVHINAFQAADISTLNTKDKCTETIDYQNLDDPVINNPFRSSPGHISGADYKITEDSGVDMLKLIHRSPIDKQADTFWLNLPFKKASSISHN